MNFYNTQATLVTAGGPGQDCAITGPSGSFYFGLLYAPLGNPMLFTFSGIYATNLSTPGLFSGGASIGVPGVTGGQTLFYKIAGWSANVGHDFYPGWLVAPPFEGFFGISQSWTGVVGGFDGSEFLPPLDLYGGSTGLQEGLVLRPLFSLEPPSPPQLTIVPAGTNIVFRWPATNCFILESTTELGSSTHWTAVSPAPVVVDALNTVTNPISSKQWYFRLRW